MTVHRLIPIALVIAAGQIHAQSLPPENPGGARCDPGFTYLRHSGPPAILDPAPCRAAVSSLTLGWSGYGHDPQHTGISANAPQPLRAKHSQTPVDQNPPAD